jgi:PIN domain nuclease of toxin-antitoxin system
LLASSRISEQARQAILDAEIVFVSPISIYEIAQKVRIGKWPDMHVILPGLVDEIEGQNFTSAISTPEVCLLAGGTAWENRDPFDRMIAATAIIYDLVLISADTAFDTLPLRRVW